MGGSRPEGVFSIRSSVVFTGVCLIIFAAAAMPFIQRDLWFDEALTILRFALLDSPAEIYNSYVIPNNQILHSIFLHWWLDLFDTPVTMRLMPLFCAAAVIIICRRQSAVIGRIPLFISLTTLIISPVFLIYATALRGYMLAMLFTAAGLICAGNFAKKAEFSAAILWFFFSLGAVAVMPGTLAALAAAVCYTAPWCGREFYKKYRFYLLGLIPLAAFALFYLPIISSLLAAAKLGEGWRCGWSMPTALAAAVIYVFAVLIIFAVISGILAVKRRKWHFFTRFFIWLLPLPAAFLFKAAPFPRVFFPFFFIWMLMIAGNLNHVAACLRRYFSRRAVKIFYIVLFIASASYCFAVYNGSYREYFSRCNSISGQDDYIYPHFLRDDFTPGNTAAFLRKNFPSAAIFATFDSDPWALMAAGGTQILFDGPRGKIPFLPKNSLLVMRLNEDPASLEKRFGGRCEKIFENKMHQVLVLK